MKGVEVETSPNTGRNMSTSQMIIVAVLSLAVVALLMVRQRQTN
jgi:LPXTG-motif cell wall-anchored protein